VSNLTIVEENEEITLIVQPTPKPSTVVTQGFGPRGAPGADGVDGAPGVPGAQGAKGDKGDPGDPGADSTVPGPQGPPGTAGANGKTVLSGTANPPSSTLGANGDFYINPDIGIIYGPKTAGSWGAPTSLRGPEGPEGPPGVDGADSTVPGPEGPQGPEGPAGADSTVPGPQGLKGDKGDTGDQGPQGIQGIPGVKGDTGDQGPQGIQGVPGTNGTDASRGPIVHNSQTGTSYTLVSGDATKMVKLSNSGPVTVTVPPNSSQSFPVGSIVSLLQQGSGQVTIAAGSGVTIRSASGLRIAAQWGVAELQKIGTDEWIAYGRLTTTIVDPITFVGIAKDGTTGGTSNSRPMPTGHQAGDILIAMAKSDGTGLSTSTAGWTLLSSPASGYYVWWKVAGSSSEPNLVITSGSGAFTLATEIAAYRGGTTVTLVQAVNGNTTVATDEGAELLTVYCAMGSNSSAAVITGPGVPVTERGSQTSGGFSSALLADEPAISGAVPARTFTNAARVIVAAIS
jgi:hypothetical protein